jgi:serine protease Do
MHGTMNPKRIFTIVGLSFLAAALVALPGSSAHKKNPTTQATEGFQNQGDGTHIYQEARPIIVDPEQNNLVVKGEDGDDDVQVFVGSGQGWLGVGVTEVTAEKVKELKLPAERGALLGKVVPDSPAAKAGLKENDVVTEINGQRVEGTEQFRRMIREIPAGRTAQFIIWRDGRSQSLSVKIGKSAPGFHMNTAVVAPGTPGTFAFRMPDLPQVDDLTISGPMFAGSPRLGIDAEDLDGDFGNFFGAPDGQGVLVRGVFSDSPASKAGLKVGDVIVSADGDRIHSIGDLREKLIDKHDQKTIKLGILRNKAPQALTVEIPPPAERHEHHNSVRTNI